LIQNHSAQDAKARYSVAGLSATSFISTGWQGQ